MNDHKQDKLYNLITYFVKNTERCYKTKLFKLLYHADFEHFKQVGQSITGLRYFAWPKGPVPIELENEIKKPSREFLEYFTVRGAEDGIRVVPKKPFSRDFITDREFEIIEKISFIFKEAITDAMIESTHMRKHPWDVTKKTKGMSKEIDYTLIFETDHPDLLSKEEYQERLKNGAALNQFFK